VKRELVALLVVFECNGEEPASGTPASRRAYSPVRSLIDSRALRVGDRLAVREETED
jgi:hypothetical protein